MAFRRDAIEAIGGFDASYTSAGDDVDVCWKLLDQGGEIAFAPAAQVRHRRRRTVRAYLKQQRGYGRSERMVSGHHPHRYNRLGQARWNGFVYGGQRLLPRLLRPVVYHGFHGHAPFQPVVSHRAERALELVGAFLPLLVPAAVVAAGAALLTPLGIAALLVILAVFPTYALAVACTVHPSHDEPEPMKLRAIVGLLHAAQPLVRTWGRLRATPLAPRAPEGPVWNGERSAWLDRLDALLVARRCATIVAPATARYDMAVSIGPLVSCRITTAVAWSWTPAIRLQYRPRVMAVLAVAMVTILASAGATTAAAVVFAVSVACAAGEAILLRNRVRDAVAVSTSGAV
jgi:hypothetical protein